MAKKITQDQVVQDNLWQNTIDSTKELISLIDVLNKELANTTKITKEALSKNKADNFEGLKDANEDVEKLNKAFEDKLKLDKQRVTLQNKLNAIEDETSKNLSELEVKTKKLTAAKNDLIKRQVQSDKQRRAGNEEIADAIKLTKEEEEELSKLTQELTVANLRKAESTKLNKEQVKDAIGLTDEYQKQSKRLNTLRKEFKNLLLVEGKATKETRRLEREVNDLDRTLKDVDAAAGQFQRNVGNYPDTLGDASAALLKTAAAALTVKGAFDSVKSSLDATEEGNEDIRKATAASTGVINTLKSSLAGLTVGLGEVVSNGVDLFTNGNKGLIETISGIVNGLEKAEASFEGLTDKAAAAAAAEIEAAKAAIDYEKILRTLDQRLSIVNGTIEQQAAIAGDSTRSFDEITRAAIAAQAAQTERASIQIQIAQEELRITRILIDAQEIAGTSSIELLNRESEGVVALQEARNQAAVERIETDKLLRQTNQDRLEIDLDILIDGFDNQKTINERRIANEKETLEERAALLKRTGELAEASFRGQKEVLEELSAAGIDVDELLLLDATELAKQIQLLGQSEIINTRTLEVIRERKIVIQDLEDAQNDLNESEQEALDIRADLLAQEEALGKQSSDNLEQSNLAIEDLEADRFANQKSSLERRIELEKEGSIERLRLEQELNDLLLEESDRKNDEEEVKAKEKRDKEIADRKTVIATLKALNDKFFEDKLRKANEEIDSTKERESQLRDLAAQGNQDAAASLGQNQKDQAEATRKKEELLQKEKQFELALAVIAAFNVALDKPGATTGSALTEAITSTSVLTSFVSSLPSFFDGTTDTGSNGTLDSNGGHMAMLHDNERVVDKKNNTKMGGVSNDDAATIVHDFNNDLLSYNSPQLTIQENRFDSNEQLISKFDELKKDVVSAINNKETYLGSDVDTMKKIMSQYYSKEGTRTKVNSKYPSRR